MLRSLFSRPSPTILQELKNAPLQALECRGWRVLLLLFRFLKLSKNQKSSPWSILISSPLPSHANPEVNSQVQRLGEPAARFPWGCCLCLAPVQGSKQQWLLLPRSPKKVPCCNSEGVSLARSKSFMQGKISCSAFQSPSAPCQQAS